MLSAGELAPLSPTTTEIVMGAVGWSLGLVVALAVAYFSYRRSRCLSRYPVWRALAIAVLAGAFPLVWVIVSLVNRDKLAEEWRQHHDARQDRATTLVH